MKKIFFTLSTLCFLFIGVSLQSFSQNGTVIHKTESNYKVLNKSSQEDENFIGEKTTNSFFNCLTTSYDSLIMTLYDMQTNFSSGQQRIFLFPDKTISVTAMGSHTSSGNTWPDRGSMYNYYNGSSWGPAPASRIETMRTGWPSIQPWGSSGECILAHQASGSLVFSTRMNKGTGSWTTSTNLLPPTGVPVMLWPRMVTSGSNHMNIHVIALTEPTSDGGNLYYGMNGALLYNRSTDGGTTWGSWQQLPGMTSANYLSFFQDTYAWAEPHGDTLAFVAGDNYEDEFIMKSINNGNTWTKTVIYHSLYDLTGYAGNHQWIYCPDGTSAITLDNSGIAHVCFGLTQDSSQDYRFYTQGLIYWNENMPQLIQSLNPDSLKIMGNYIGWIIDTSIFTDTINHISAYFTSLTSNPGITIDNDNNIFVIWAGVTSYVDSLGYYLRHIYERTGHINGSNSIVWDDPIRDLTCDIEYNNKECMYPDISPGTDDNIYILFQAGKIAGSYVKCMAMTPMNCYYFSPTNHEMVVLKSLKSDLGVGIGEKKKMEMSLFVSENFPNPFKNSTWINVTIEKKGRLWIEINDVIGQHMTIIEKGNVLPGKYQFEIKRNGLSAGVYFCTVRLDYERITKKMVVE
jgi:hypothetical protein